MQRNSVFRFFFATLDSGVTVSYKLYDDNNELVLETPEEYDSEETDVVFHQIAPSSSNKKTKGLKNVKPFRLELQYKYTKEAEDINACPLIELYLIV